MKIDAELKGLKLARIATLSFSLVSQLKKQLEDCKNSGLEITLISGTDDGMSIIDDLDIKHKQIFIPRDISLIKDLVALIKLYLCFRHNKFNIVHSTTPKAGLLTAIAAYFARVPVRLHTFTGQAWANLSGWKRSVCILMDKVIILLNSRVYADSNSQVKFLYENKVISSIGDITVLGNGSLAGVDLDIFTNKKDKIREEKRASFNIPDSAFVFIYLGRINLEKGIRELLQAFNEVIRKDPKAVLLLVGPMDIKKPIESMNIIEKISNNENIFRFNYTDEPQEFLFISDILCCPSHREGFGTVIIEAGAMGIPSIGSNVIGLKDSIIHNETGILFEKANSKELGKHMYELMDNSLLRKQLGINARKNAIENYSSTRLSSLILDQYKNLL